MMRQGGTPRRVIGDNKHAAHLAKKDPIGVGFVPVSGKGLFDAVSTLADVDGMDAVIAAGGADDAHTVPNRSLCYVITSTDHMVQRSLYFDGQLSEARCPAFERVGVVRHAYARRRGTISMEPL